MFAVASSRITTLFLRRIALAIWTKDFSPELKLSPVISKFKSESSSDFSSSFLAFFSSSVSTFSSLSFLSYSFLRMIVSRPAFLRIARISSSGVFPDGSRLYLRLPLYMVGSWGMIVIFSLTYLRLISLMSTPSMKMFPVSFSTILVRARLKVLFPAPVLPTIPILCPPYILVEHFLSTRSVFSLYLSSTSFRTISPFCGHDGSSCLG